VRCRLGSVSDGGSPEKAAQFASDRDGDNTVGFAAGLHPLIDVVQPALGLGGDREDLFGLTGLAGLQDRADARSRAVVPGGLDQQPASER
jgi:hypothetical protein